MIEAKFLNKRARLNFAGKYSPDRWIADAIGDGYRKFKIEQAHPDDKRPSYLLLTENGDIVMKTNGRGVRLRALVTFDEMYTHFIMRNENEIA